MSDEEFVRPPEDADDDEEWETVETKVARPVGIVLSVRMSRETADQLRAVAAEADMTTSGLARQAIEEYLAGRSPARSIETADVRISSDGAPVTFYYGRSSASQTAGDEPVYSVVSAGQ